MTRAGATGSAAGLVAVAILASACGAPSPGTARPTSTAPSSSSSSSVTSSFSSSVTSASGARSSPITSTGSPGATDDASTRRAQARIAALAAPLGRQGVSVDAVDLADGDEFRAGARGGMTEASVAKLDIVETLMLRRQRSHGALSETQRKLATQMIEQSDNDAADSLWEMLGGHVAVDAANDRLGLHCTRLDPGYYWGLSTTCATDQLALLRALVVKRGPLTRRSQRIVLRLMGDVESDQRWGVGAVADPGTAFANKNGWLSVFTDDDRWAVNSVGIVTVDGHRTLLAVLSQHDDSFADGIALVQSVGRIAVGALPRSA